MVYVVLNVAEKNDAAKNIAKMLSGGRTGFREGLSKFNKIYTFQCDIPQIGRGCQMLFTSVSGHLLDVEFAGENYNNWQRTNPYELFTAPVVRQPYKNMIPIERTLKREARNATHLIIWTDCDREGENIGAEIVDVATSSNNRVRVWRARFSEITAHSIQQAISRLVALDERAAESVECRRELDLRIGAAFTRFQSMGLKREIPVLKDLRVISYGPCQFPTLGFVVERYRAIEEFIPEAFWRLVIRHTFTDPLQQQHSSSRPSSQNRTHATNCHSDSITVDFQWARGRLFDEDICSAFLDICRERPEATVISTVERPKSKWRPQPMDTITMEKLASRKLRLSAKRTMDIAEKLYTRGIISYPRTETTIFVPNMDLRSLVQEQCDSPQWGGFAQNILSRGGPNPRNGRKNDGAHPPIHPLKLARSGELQGFEETKVYELVVRHFLACCSDDARGVETTVKIDVNGEEFNASGLAILERNYLDVYPYEKWEGKPIVRLVQGTRFVPLVIQLAESVTQPPRLLSEADLIGLMEKHGIGTDATHAEHIEKIQERKYVGKNAEQRFVPGKLGMGLVNGYDAIGLRLAKPDLRGALERDLVRICEGQATRQQVLEQNLSNYKQLYRETEGSFRAIIGSVRRYVV